MKTLTVSEAMAKLEALRERFRRVILEDYESAAKDCLTCEHQGACCTDAHFVNVRITSIEAEALRQAVDDLPEHSRGEVIRRTSEAISSFDHPDRDNDRPVTYPCPLFEIGTGCLVHETAKPLPCINHACYEDRSDLPPDELLADAEMRIARLNARVFGNAWTVREIPLWLRDQFGGK